MAKADKKPTDGAPPTDPVTPDAPVPTGPVVIEQFPMVSGPTVPPELESMRAENAALKARIEKTEQALAVSRAEAKKTFAGYQDLGKQQAAEIDRLRGELARHGREHEARAKSVVPPIPAPVSTGIRRARVSVPDTHVGAIEVEIPAHLSGAEGTLAAIQAAKDARGIVSFGASPQVEFLN